MLRGIPTHQIGFPLYLNFVRIDLSLVLSSKDFATSLQSGSCQWSVTVEMRTYGELSTPRTTRYVSSMILQHIAVEYAQHVVVMDPEKCQHLIARAGYADRVFVALGSGQRGQSLTMLHVVNTCDAHFMWFEVNIQHDVVRVRCRSVELTRIDIESIIINVGITTVLLRPYTQTLSGAICVARVLSTNASSYSQRRRTVDIEPCQPQ